jgi:hypothetical protein
MSISTYAELQTAISNHLRRSDLTSAIPDLIALAESRLNRILRSLAMEQTASLTASVGSRVLSLPARFLEPISLRITVSGQESPLIPKSPSEMDAVIGTGNATPAYYTINNQIEFDCPADFAYPLTLRYYKRLDLAADTTNALLTSDPDIYLYASLLAASPYIKEDARILLWKQAVDEFVEEANSVASKARGQALMSVDVGLAGVGSFNVNTGDYRR